MAAVSTVVNNIDGKIVTDYFDPNGFFLGASYEHADGSGTWFTADGQSGSWSGATQFWEVGATLGIGFQLWGDSNGDIGFGWTSGIGITDQVGYASSPEAAITDLNPDGLTIARMVDPFPTTVNYNPTDGLTFDHLGLSVGAFVIDHDPLYHGTPNWSDQFHQAVSSELGGLF